MIAIITLALLGMVLLYLGIFNKRGVLLTVSVLGILIALASQVPGFFESDIQPGFHGMVLFDPYAKAFSALILISALLIFLLSKYYFDSMSSNIPEYYALMVFSMSGALMVVSYHNLAMLFIGIEIMSVALYILAGIRKKDLQSNEAAMKYFLMGAFSTGFLLFGIALLYGASGTFDIGLLKDYFVSQTANLPAYAYVGIVMIMIGLLFKVGAAPFHFWTPDVYEGSPILITAFMSTVVKIAAFAALFRLFSVSLATVNEFWTPLLEIVSVITLIVGNVVAMVQASFKRMLAYSSISHAGYMLFALIGLSPVAASGLFIYGLGYAMASIVAFATLILVKRSQGSENFEAFNGLGRNNPWLAIPLTVSMFSLAGIPLTAGFIGKFMMFSEVLSQNHVTLIILAAINAAVGIYYYFHVVINLYFKDQQSTVIEVNSTYKVVLALCILITLIIGLYPSFITGLL